MLDHLLGLETAVGSVGDGVLLPDGGQLREPGRPVASRGAGFLKRLQEGSRPAGDGNVHLPVFPDFGRIDVDLDDFGLRGECLGIAEDPVAESRAQGQNQIGMLQGVIPDRRSVHSDSTQNQLPVLWVQTMPHQRIHRRDLVGVEEFVDHRSRFGEGHATPDQGQRASAFLDHLPGRRDLPGMDFGRRQQSF